MLAVKTLSCHPDRPVAVIGIVVVINVESITCLLRISRSVVVPLPLSAPQFRSSPASCWDCAPLQTRWMSIGGASNERMG